MWTFVSQKKRKVWRRLAVERASQRIVAWTLGSRGKPRQLPNRYRRCWYFTDEWKANAKGLDHRPCSKLRKPASP